MNLEVKVSVLFRKAIRHLEYAISCSTEAKYLVEEALIYIWYTEQIAKIWGVLVEE